MIISNWGDEGVVSNLSDFQYREGHTNIANDWFAFEYMFGIERILLVYVLR